MYHSIGEGGDEWHSVVTGVAGMTEIETPIGVGIVGEANGSSRDDNQGMMEEWGGREIVGVTGEVGAEQLGSSPSRTSMGRT